MFVILSFISTPIFCQSDDSLLIKIHKSWYKPDWKNSDWKRHNHIINFNGNISSLNFIPNSGAIGYKYLYSFENLKFLRFGVRTGFWFRKTKSDVPKISSRDYFSYSTSIVLNTNLWQLINFEISGGFYNDISWPTKYNTFDEKNTYYGSPIWFFKSGINIIIFNHFNFDIGYELNYDYIPKSNYNRIYFSVGYKI